MLTPFWASVLLLWEAFGTFHRHLRHSKSTDLKQDSLPSNSPSRFNSLGQADSPPGWFSLPSDTRSPPREHLVMSGDIVYCYATGGCYWHLGDKSQDGAEHPQCTGQSPTTKNDPAQHASHARVEKPWFRSMRPWSFRLQTLVFIPMPFSFP